MHIVIQELPASQDKAVIFNGICTEAFNAKQMPPIEEFAVFIKDDQGSILGGATCNTLYGCLYIDMLWIDARFRGKQWGSKLIAQAEKIGRERKCSFATVATMDWEALGFYQKLGYEIEFVRGGYVNESKMYILRKQF